MPIKVNCLIKILNLYKYILIKAGDYRKLHLLCLTLIKNTNKFIEPQIG